MLFSWYVLGVKVTEGEVPRRGRGRRSLSGAGDSPQLRVRLPEDLRRALADRAEREGTSISDLARHTLAAAVSGQLRPENRVQLELHREVLGKLIGDLGPVRVRAHRNIDRMRTTARGSQAQRWLDEWSELVDGPPARLIEVFLGEDEHSIDLRQMSPFAGVLTDPERRAAIRRARSDA
jgi:plasmid stability protein